MTSTVAVTRRPPALAARLPVTPGTRRTRAGAVLLAIGLLGFLVSLVGGYAGMWSWTGYATNGTVWDWLQLALLPIALSGLPFLWRDEPGDRRLVAMGLALVSGALAILVMGGYWWRWSWTGFTGNTLWEWMNLVLLPLAIAVSPLWVKTRFTHPRKWMAGLAVPGVVVLVVVAGGYRFGWAWTGFAGNTLWDWMRLLVVPLVLPVLFASLDQHQHELGVLRAVAARHLADGVCLGGADRQN